MNLFIVENIIDIFDKLIMPFLEILCYGFGISTVLNLTSYSVFRALALLTNKY